MDKYLVSAWVWNPKRKENEYKILMETKNKLEAEKRFNQIKVTNDIPQVMIELEGDDYIDLLWKKDSTGVYAIY